MGALAAVVIGGFLIGGAEVYGQDGGYEGYGRSGYDYPAEVIIPITEAVTLIDEYEEYVPSYVVAGTVTNRTLFPALVEELDFGSTRRIVRTYELQPDESAHDIRTGSFERDGFYFEISEITRNRTEYMSRRDFVKVVEIETSSNNANAVMPQLEEFMEYLSYDGYSGILRLDLSSVSTAASGTRQEGFTATQRQTFPNLSNPDISLIPSTVTVNNRQYTLADVSWSGGAEDTVDFTRIAGAFTANATFTRQGTRNITLGYITTAEYVGTLSRINSGETTYSATFIGTPVSPPEMSQEELEEYLAGLQNHLNEMSGTNGYASDTAEYVPEVPREPFSINWAAVGVMLAALGAAGAGFWYFFLRGNVEVKNLQGDEYVKIGRAMLSKKNLVIDLTPFTNTAKTSAFEVNLGGFLAKGLDGKTITLNYGSNTFQHQVAYTKGTKIYSMHLDF